MTRRSPSDRSRSRSKSRSCSDKKNKNCKRRSPSYRSRYPSKSKSKSPKIRKFAFCDIYQYFKNRLVKDEQLMIAGSSAYNFITNNQADNISLNQAVSWNNPVLNYNIDYIALGSPFFVRESGVYMLLFEIGTGTASQFTFFVNGIAQELSTMSTNSGAGQVLSRQIFTLKENDNFTVRNYSSLVNVGSDNSAGGAQIGNSATFVIFKIAPYEAPVHKKECLSDRKKKLFKSLEEKVECDSELMPKGYTVQGSFINTAAQSVALEGDVAFASQTETNDICWNVANPTQVLIKEDGIYKIYFQLTTQTACQFAVTVNGVANETTTVGINKGSGQLTNRSLLALKKGDVLTLRNHSSNVGAVTITTNAGGLATSVNALFQLFKMAPLCRPCIKPVPCELEKILDCWYPLFRNYLLGKHHLQIAGSPNYINVVNAHQQVIAQNQPIFWSTITTKKEVRYIPGEKVFHVKRSGVYDVFVEASVDQPMQLTLFKNGVALPTTTFGRDSGASRVYLRQLVALYEGECISVNNYLSASPNVDLVSTGNGQYVNNNASFCMFRMHAILNK
jgi:hypothetical protein